MLATATFVAWCYQFVVWTFSSPSVWTGGRLPSSLYTFLSLHSGLARDYHANGFPEFDRYSRMSFLTRSPLKDQLEILW